MSSKYDALSKFIGDMFVDADKTLAEIGFEEFSDTYAENVQIVLSRQHMYLVLLWLRTKPMTAVELRSLMANKDRSNLDRVLNELEEFMFITTQKQVFQCEECKSRKLSFTKERVYACKECGHENQTDDFTLPVPKKYKWGKSDEYLVKAFQLTDLGKQVLEDYALKIGGENLVHVRELNKRLDAAESELASAKLLLKAKDEKIQELSEMANRRRY